MLAKDKDKGRVGGLPLIPCNELLNPQGVWLLAVLSYLRLPFRVARKFLHHFDTNKM